MGKKPSPLPLLQTQVFPGSWKFPSQPISCFADQWGRSAGSGYFSLGCGSPTSPLIPRVPGARGPFCWVRSTAGREPDSCQKKSMWGGEGKKKKNSRTKSLVEGCWLVFLWVLAAERYVPAQAPLTPPLPGCSRRWPRPQRRPRRQGTRSPRCPGRPPATRASPNIQDAAMWGSTPRSTLCHLFSQKHPRGDEFQGPHPANDTVPTQLSTVSAAKTCPPPSWMHVPCSSARLLQLLVPGARDGPGRFGCGTDLPGQQRAGTCHRVPRSHSSPVRAGHGLGRCRVTPRVPVTPSHNQGPNVKDTHPTRHLGGTVKTMASALLSLGP